LRRLGRPGATASWRSQHRFWSVQAGLPFSQRCVAPFHAILCHSPLAGSSMSILDYAALLGH